MHDFGKWNLPMRWVESDNGGTCCVWDNASNARRAPRITSYNVCYTKLLRNLRRSIFYGFGVLKVSFMFRLNKLGIIRSKLFE